ncbi:hypothetical protein [Flavobacterium sp. XGLA_31]|uniref:hypothetical protein n=1 Tax=Flavobacterium sp. XGLA_31 TaxID=3447666 RepID=UPI003F40F7AA
MKTNLIIVLCFVTLLAKGQSGEFKVHDNGLIYSESAVAKLKHIVDSLNLKFKVCNVNKQYYANKQTLGHYVSLEKSKVKEALKDIKENISYDAFIAKYPKAAKEEKLVVIQSEYTDYDKKKRIAFHNLRLGENYNHEIEFPENDAKALKGSWIFSYSEKTSYSDEEVEAFYLLEPFKSNPIPSQYAKLIQYSECLVDTTAQVFYDKAKESGVRYYDTTPNKATAFIDYVERILKRPSFEMDKFDVLVGMDTVDFEKPNKKLSKKKREEHEKLRNVVEAEYNVFREKMEAWQASRWSRVDSLKVNDTRFMSMLNEAYLEAKEKQTGDDEFEDYIGRYVSKEAELEMKRNRRVIGGCSMDLSPRIHAFNIALLSAETTKWEIFLRSHLDIMNDRFDRVSDGSWAQAERSTYIKELEVLNIDVLDLIIGISLRVSNPAENHYFGSINRIGRALAESKDKPAIEAKLTAMIGDKELDDYNRILLYFLYDNYVYNLKEENLKTQNQEKLKGAIAQLPDYIASRIVKE